MRGEQGTALVITLLVVALLTAIGASLVLATTADQLIAANAGASAEAFYAAEAAFERTAAELAVAPDLSAVLDGSARSAFTDGAPAGVRVLADGTRLDLAAVVNRANCQLTQGCNDAAMDASRRHRPWGARNPRWRLYAYGPLRPRDDDVQTQLPVYVVALVADDPSETDGDPLRDGAPTGGSVNPGAGILLIRGEAFGRRAAHRVVQGAVFRRDVAARARWDGADPATRGPAPPAVPVLQRLSWEEIR